MCYFLKTFEGPAGDDDAAKTILFTQALEDVLYLKVIIASNDIEQVSLQFDILGCIEESKYFIYL